MTDEELAERVRNVCRGDDPILDKAADRIKELREMVDELLRSNWDKSWPSMRKYDTFEEYYEAVLGEKKDV